MMMSVMYFELNVVLDVAVGCAAQLVGALSMIGADFFVVSSIVV